MSLNIPEIVSKPLSRQIILGLLLIRFIWLTLLYPFLRLAGSLTSWFIMFELAALKLIDETTEQCLRTNGGTFELHPGRLGYHDWLIHHGCVGREEGYDYSVYAGVS
jgi:hypothetical protein